ncbi:putative prophage protein [Escherichia coli]|nr:putative prophage protein [Escherichia coli]
MNTAFALVLTVFLVSGEPVDIAVSVHRTMQECVTAATEQKIPGNCYPVDKVIHQDNNEIPAGLLKQFRNKYPVSFLYASNGRDLFTLKSVMR